MDLDAYVGAHHREWRRLEELSRRRRCSGAEADELLDLYQRVATQLSVVRSSAPDPDLVAYLSSLLARARTRATGSRSVSWQDLGRFLGQTFPAALYRTRWWWLTTAAVNVAVAFALGWWLLRNPQVESTLLSPEEIRQLVESDFENYYREYAASSFAARVWTNNAWVAALCIAFGVLGVPIILVLWLNVLNVAVVGSVMVHHGRGSLFFGLILPHGLLELTAVFVAAGAGLRLFWAWVEPGPRPRSQALATEGRSAVAVALGLVLVLLVSGVIEAFVTPSALPTWARITVGVVAEAAFLGYVFTAGRRAARSGLVGDVDPRDAGDVAPVRA